MSYVHLSQNLADAFNVLASQVQTLADQKTVLEHKLRFAHEQVQFLADKYAPTNPEIAETLAKLQLPPHTSVDTTAAVPLPLRKTPLSQHQLALVIRDGRRLANQLTSLGDSSKTTGSTRESLSHTSHQTTMSTALEQDFTVEGKRGCLECPFSNAVSADGAAADDAAAAAAPTAEQTDVVQDGAPHKSSDPICAALYDDSASQPAGNGSNAGKCPIRYMDTHSPEEIARYVETHKHELPRSHEVCLRRYQHNELEIRKLDSKYGNLVSMIEGLGQIHQPMLPEAEAEAEAEERQTRSAVDKASNERVENWAQDVSASTNPEDQDEPASDDVDRQSHFDRPLKEVRVGESPSRPWGISVPAYEPSGHEEEQPLSPPPAPVRMMSPMQNAQSAQGSPKAPKKCPFDHTKLTAFPSLDPSAKQPEGIHAPALETTQHPPFTPIKQAAPRPPSPRPEPTFVNPDMIKGAGSSPQMIFTGPVFIGYPIDQAMQIVNQYRGNQ